MVPGRHDKCKEIALQIVLDELSFTPAQDGKGLDLAGSWRGGPSQ